MIRLAAMDLNKGDPNHVAKPDRVAQLRGDGMRLEHCSQLRYQRLSSECFTWHRFLPPASNKHGDSYVGRYFRRVSQITLLSENFSLDRKSLLRSPEERVPRGKGQHDISIALYNAVSTISLRRFVRAK
jgi:hypothetical protein